MSTANTSLSAKSEEYYQSIREDMLQFIPNGTKKTLEFGCGEGNFSELIKNRFNAETWAVEIDENSARKASEKLHKVIHNDAFKALDELPGNYFDCIICFDFLEHLVDPYSLLESLKSKLTKNGVIATSIPNIRYYSAFKDFILHGNWDYKDQGIMDRTHLRFFTRKSIIKMFKQLDFEILTMEGLHPTSSSTFKLLHLLTFGFFSDTRFKHFVNIVKSKPQAD